MLYNLHHLHFSIALMSSFYCRVFTVVTIFFSSENLKCPETLQHGRRKSQLAEKRKTSFYLNPKIRQSLKQKSRKWQLRICLLRKSATCSVNYVMLSSYSFFLQVGIQKDDIQNISKIILTFLGSVCGVYMFLLNSDSNVIPAAFSEVQESIGIF